MDLEIQRIRKLEDLNITNLTQNILGKTMWQKSVTISTNILGMVHLWGYFVHRPDEVTLSLSQTNDISK